MAYTKTDPITLVVEVEGKSVRLGSPEKWARAVRQGDLRPQTPVDVELNGQVVARTTAAEVPQLRTLLGPVEHAADPAPAGARPPAPASAPTPTQACATPTPGPRAVKPVATAAEAVVSRPKDTSEGRANAAKRSRALGVSVAVLALALVVWVAIATSQQSAPNPAAAPPAVAPAPEAASPAEPLVPATSIPANKIIDWNAERDGSPAVYAVAGLRITLFSRSTGDIPKPVIRVEAPGMATQEYEGVEGFSTASANFGVGQVDVSTAEPEIFFLSFTGGAHCCTSVQMFQRKDDRWRVTDVGLWDGEPLATWPTDRDGDKIPDLVLTDNRFLYAFGPYSGGAPLMVLNINRGVVRDVSSASRFQPVFQAALEPMTRGCLEHSNSSCAALVADAARAKQAPWAWRLMLENYDRSATWDLPKGCSVALVKDVCPAGNELVFPSYPEALEDFLKRAGYLAGEEDLAGAG